MQKQKRDLQNLAAVGDASIHAENDLMGIIIVIGAMLIMTGIFALVALLTPLLALHDPFRCVLTQTDLPPMWVQGTIVKGTSEYIFGTDMYGRDILIRLISRSFFFLANVLNEQFQQ